MRPALPPVMVEPDLPGDDGIDLRTLFEILRRRWKTIAVTTALLTAAAVAYAVLTPPLYTASSLLLLEPRDQRVLQTEVLPTGAGSDPTLVESQVRVVTSSGVLNRVIKDLNLAEVPEFGGSATAKDERETDALAVLTKRISAARADRTYLLEIKATSRDKNLSAKIANAVANAYLADQTDAARAATRRTSDALMSRLGELRAALQKADEKVQAYRTAHGLVGQDGSATSQQQLAELNQRLIMARATLATAQARYDQVTRSGVSGTAEALASQVITALRTQLAEISRREADLTATLGDRHPAVVRVRAERATVESQIAQEIGRYAESARNALAVAQGDVNMLQKELDRLTGRDLADGAALIGLRELQREADAIRELYQSMLVRVKQTSEQEQLETSSARILATASVPTAAGFPPKPVIIGVALAFGLGLGAALALLRERFDDRIREAAQLRRIGLNVFATVPPFGGPKKAGVRGFDYAIRLLRAELRDTLERSREQSILVVSTKHGDGAPAIALNLALAAVAGGERVLIVDADVAHRTLSTLVAPTASVGLADVLSGRVALREALVGNGKAGFAALPLVTKSFGPQRPSRAAFERLLAEARPLFDYVIFVGAPIEDEPDGRTIAEATDQVALVLRAEVTTRRDITGALRALRIRGEKTCGVILNQPGGNAAAA